ncbi:MAG: hypothetical protein RJB03_1130 [Bacteroidota bacterium]
MKLVLFLFAANLFFVEKLISQRLPDEVYQDNIKTIKFSRFGEPLTYPVISLNGPEQLELNFDDMAGGVKNYFYSFVLCNADWTPAQMSTFDYVKGFTQVRISTYRNSSVSFTRYTHYQAILPDKNAVPTKSGNYLLKVYLNGDTSRLAFTKRFLVVEPRINLGAAVLHPFGQQYFQTHHRLQIQLDTKNFDVRYPQQQIKIIALQNFRWDNPLTLSTPTFQRQDLLQYSNENEMVMPAGKEFRWLNLRSFRLLGDRIRRQENTDSSFSLFVKEDLPRLPKQYFFYRDANGLFINETVEKINPYWNADYATVKFTFVPPSNQAYRGSDLVIMGELTNYAKDKGAQMQFNPDKGVYEATLLLKQGYYDYQYSLRQFVNGKYVYQSTDTEQNAWETENAYMILVYFRALGGRHDELIAIRQFNSQFNKDLR